MLGIFAFTPTALKGAVIQMINHGISTGALFLIVGIVYERRHTRMIAEFGGLSSRMPLYAAVFLIITMSSIGLPGLNGFIGEFMILMGMFPVNFTWAAIATSGIILGAGYMLWLYQRVMFGKLENPANQQIKDLNLRELLTFIPLIIMAFWIGIMPKPFLDILDKPVEKIVRAVNPDYYNKPALEIKKVEPPQHQEPGTGSDKSDNSDMSDPSDQSDPSDPSNPGTGPHGVN